MEDSFWMVKGDGPSSVVHLDRSVAEAEAKRLARENPGKTFYVMQAVVAFVKDDVRRVELEADQVSF